MLWWRSKEAIRDTQRSSKVTIFIQLSSRHSLERSVVEAVAVNCQGLKYTEKHHPCMSGHRVRDNNSACIHRTLKRCEQNFQQLNLINHSSSKHIKINVSHAQVPPGIQSSSRQALERSVAESVAFNFQGLKYTREKHHLYVSDPRIRESSSSNIHQKLKHLMLQQLRMKMMQTHQLRMKMVQPHQRLRM